MVLFVSCLKYWSFDYILHPLEKHVSYARVAAQPPNREKKNNPESLPEKLTQGREKKPDTEGKESLINSLTNNIS